MNTLTIGLTIIQNGPITEKGTIHLQELRPLTVQFLF